MTGIVSVQGDFAEHEKMLSDLGEESFEIRQARDLERDLDRLIFPGGESTVQSRLIKQLGMYDKLKEKINSNTPVLATCAGLILLSQTVDGAEGFFGALPVCTKRNAYGRQTGSFFTTGKFGNEENIPMSFIRAPYIESVSGGVSVMSVTDGNITAVKYKKIIALSYHPELCDDYRIFKEFLNL